MNSSFIIGQPGRTVAYNYFFLFSNFSSLCVSYKIHALRQMQINITKQNNAINIIAYLFKKLYINILVINVKRVAKTPIANKGHNVKSCFMIPPRIFPY